MWPLPFVDILYSIKKMLGFQRSVHASLNLLCFHFVSGAKEAWQRLRRKSLARLQSSSPVLISETVVEWSFTFLSGNPTLKGDLIRKLWTEPLWSICFSSGSWCRKETLTSSLLLTFSVFFMKPSCGVLEDAFLNSSTPHSDALLGPSEEPCCLPVHGSPYRNGCHVFIIHCFGNERPFSRSYYLKKNAF